MSFSNAVLLFQAPMGPIARLWRVIPALEAVFVLHWWLKYMEARPTSTSTHISWQDRSHCIVWVDASGSKRIIAVIIEVEGVLHHTNLQVEAVIMKDWFIRQDNYIGILEMLAIILGVYTFASMIQGNLVTVYNGNSGVVHSVLRAASRSPEINQMVARLWLRVATEKIGMVIFKVESGANPSDEPSRLEFTWVNKHGAIRTDPYLLLWVYHLWDSEDMTLWSC